MDSVTDKGRLLESLLLALVPRADFDSTALRLYVCSYELGRFLGWDGIGVFSLSEVRSPEIALVTRPPWERGDRCVALAPHWARDLYRVSGRVLEA
jgi:hypothetical protein